MFELSSGGTKLKRFPFLNIVSVLGLSLTLISTSSFAAKDGLPNGKPFQALQEQLDALSTQLSELETTVDQQQMSTVPVEVSVNCNAGESVADVMTQYENGLAPLTVNITGLCQETIFIFRNKVTLNGVSGDAEISSTSTLYGAVTVSRGANKVNVNGLKISGVAYGVIVAKNSQVEISNSEVFQASLGVLSLDSSLAEVTGSMIHDVNTGVYASRSSVISVSNTVIENVNSGFGAAYSSVINLLAAAPDGTSTNGVTISSNSIGGIVQAGSSAAILNSEISATFYGVYVLSLGSAQINGTTLTNSQSGVYARKNTSVSFGPGNTFNNNIFGVQCSPDTSYQVSPPGALPGVMTGNAIDVANCTDF